MCDFITIGLDQRGAASLAAPETELGIGKCINPSIKRSFPKSDSLFWVTWGSCSCELVPHPVNHETEAARQRKKYKAKGWSDAKIERALASIEGDRLRKDADTSKPITKLFDLIGEKIKLCGSVRIMIHSYRGLVDEEEVPVVGHSRMKFSEALSQGGFPSDTVVNVEKD